MNENETKETKVEGTTEEVKVETPPVAQETAAATPVKETLGQKVKKHWKGLTAAAAGLLIIGGSAVAAYRRGKAAQYDPTVGDDGSINPNE